MTLVDTDILSDVIGRESSFTELSSLRLVRAKDIGPVAINPIIYCEISPLFQSEEEQREALEQFELLPLPYEAARLASLTWLSYRGGKRPARILADFYIGAHASLLGMDLLTRNKKDFARWFPNLKLSN